MKLLSMTDLKPNCLRGPNDGSFHVNIKHSTHVECVARLEREL